MENISYFDVIPNELSLMILHNLNEYALIKIAIDNIGITILDKILISPSFWNEHVRLIFPDIPFKYIPQYLYDYSGQNIVAITKNYLRFKSDYLEAKYKMDTILNQLTTAPRIQKGWKIKIYNNQVITNILLRYFSSNRQLHDFLGNVFEYPYIETFTDLMELVLVYGGDNFNISKEEAFGLLMHTVCNEN